MSRIEYTPSFLAVVSEIAAAKSAAEKAKNEARVRAEKDRFRSLMLGQLGPNREEIMPTEAAAKVQNNQTKSASSEDTTGSNAGNTANQAGEVDPQLKNLLEEMQAGGMGSLTKTLYDRFKPTE